MSTNDTPPAAGEFPQRVLDRGHSQARSLFIGSAIDDAGLDVYEFRLYAHLKRRAQDGTVWGKQENMAVVCGMSRKTINEVLKRLADKGWIQQERRTHKGQRTTNLIYLLEPPCNPRLHGQVTQGYTAMSPTVTTKGTPHQGTPHQGLKDGAKNRAGQEQASADGETTPQPPVRENDQPTRKAAEQSRATGLEKVPPPLAVPPALAAHTGWEEAWGEWLAYRRARRLTCAPVTLQAQLRKLAAMPDPLGVIEQSITNGWAGLFQVKQAHTGRPQTQAEANQKFLDGMEETRAAIKGVFDE